MMNKNIVLNKKVKHRKKMNRYKLGNFFAVVILLIGAIFTLMPLLIMVLTALTKDAYQMSFPYRVIPKPWYFGNLTEVWKLIPLARGFLNTIIVTGSVTIVGTLVSALAAFAFAKIEFPGREKMFLVFLATMMIPFAVLLIPQFVGFSKLNWVDTLLPIIVPGLFGNVAVIFFLRQFFRGIPDDLIHAAKIDGAGYFKIFFKVILPLGAPAIAAQGILSFMGCWNDFFGPMIYLNSPEKQTIQVLLTNFQGQYSSNYSLIMAAALMAMLPLILIFLFAQKYIIESIAISGIKG